jgi:hypothetical protein
MIDSEDYDRLTDKDYWFRVLCIKYVQRADSRQKEMGLQYTEAETHDLAEQIVRIIRGF